jgi:hypothetical protein
MTDKNQLKNTVATVNGNGTVAIVNDNDLAALANAARDLLPTDFVGAPLKFIDGRWFIRKGKDEEVDVGTTESFVADMRSYAEEWVRWIAKKPTHKITGRRVDGYINPPRHTLPEYDKKDWPIGPKGPKDPWQESLRIVLRDLVRDELVTWVSSSWGGRGAMGELLDAYLADVKNHVGQMPVVLLTSWDKPSLDYGKVPTPRFKVIGWQAFGPDASPPGDPAKGAATRKALEHLQTLALPSPAAAPKAAQRSDMDDEIPF